MKIKVREASNIELDYLAAKIAGRTIKQDPKGLDKREFWIWEDGDSGHTEIRHQKIGDITDRNGYSPTTRHDQGGPILAQLINEGFKVGKLFLLPMADAGLSIKISRMRNGVAEIAYGATPISAAVRMHVTMELGEETDVPNELCIDHAFEAQRETEFFGDHC